jgi:EAL domain-containing protein (putative c-di-GMP-specific phosphodiesterase class I)
VAPTSVVAVCLAWLRHWGAGSHAATGVSPVARTRPFALHPWRLAAAGLLAGALAALAGAGTAWQDHGAAARSSAAMAMDFVDTRLQAIDDEITLLASQPALRHGLGLCGPAVAEALAQASMASTLVKRFFLVDPNSGAACAPDAQSSPGPVTAVRGPALVLGSTGQISTRLQAQRAGPNGTVVVAELDPRAFEAGADEAHWNMSLAAVTVTLLSAQAHRLAPLGHAAPRGASTVGALGHVAWSSQHGVAVAADVNRAALWAHAWRRGWVCAALALLAVAAATAVLWRRTVLRARLSHRIARGLRKRQFEPYVQPIVDMGSGKCCGVEVLMRWNHPERGILAPSQFIDEAERSGLILGMSDLVMLRAAHRLSPLMRADPGLYVSINMTPSQLRQSGFAQRLGEIFHADTVPREQVLLELTEREIVDPAAGRALAQLRSEGWRIAIDDFGTGQSSLAWLEDLGVDRIKIDRAFVQTIDESTVRRPVLDAIIALAAQLGVRLIAEGVETRSQWDYLAGRGVQSAQGYLMARPMSIDSFGRWLEDQTVARTDAGAALSGVPSSTARAAPPGTAPHPASAADPQLRAVWDRLRSPGGVDVRDRIYNLRNYRQCFVGREAVDWLARHQRIGRHDAVRLGQRLLALGLLSHVLDEHDFEDRELFYRLAPPATGAAAAAPDVQDLRHDLRGAAGPQLRNHSRGLMLHRRCATGRSIVDWIVQRHRTPRPVAVQWSALLMRQGALRHVFDDQPFRDDQSLYRPV